MAYRVTTPIFDAVMDYFVPQPYYRPTYLATEGDLPELFRATHYEFAPKNLRGQHIYQRNSAPDFRVWPGAESGASFLKHLRKGSLKNVIPKRKPTFLPGTHYQPGASRLLRRRRRKHYRRFRFKPP